MSLASPVDRSAMFRRALSRALVVALCAAAVTALSVILAGDFDRNDARVIATSLGFAVFSATAASGASLRFRSSQNMRAFGVATVAVSGASFLLLINALWSHHNETWRWFGSATLATLACSHVSLVWGALRCSDGRAIRGLGSVSIALSLMDSGLGIAVVTGAVDEVDEGFGQLIAALVVMLLLTTALPPILRRLERPLGSPTTPPTTAGRSGSASTASRLAVEIAAAAERIETLNADLGSRASEIRRECERLRQLARSFAN